MKKTIIIFASQDYESANHKNLWKKLADKNTDVIVVDVPCDIPTNIFRKKAYRKSESRQGLRKIEEGLYVVRPFLIIRPDYAPHFLFRSIAKQIEKLLVGTYPQFSQNEKLFIAYNAYWVRIIRKLNPDYKVAYYLFDEVRADGRDNAINKKRYLDDEYACRNSNVIYTMTDKLRKSRLIYNKNIITLGNGATIPPKYDGEKIKDSVAFIGNFRDWIDKDILEGIISGMPDKRFIFAGNIEENMRSFFNHIMNDYSNTFYAGRIKKSKISELYQMSDCVIVPYLQNEFIKATRPIKIIESILAGTPVVTVPVNGYRENKFIRFAESVEEFKNQINLLSNNPINDVSNKEEYEAYVNQNTWESIGNKIKESI